MTRRSWLSQVGKWLLGLGLFYPLYAFVTQKRYRPPIRIKIDKALANGQYVIEPEFILFQTSTGPIAVSRRCTHLGCIVNYREQEKIFLCPCHQSHFKWDGKYISGPAKKDLPRLKVTVLEGGQGFLIEIPRGGV